MPTQVDNAEVVAGLRTSRNKLNHGGRHWIKSALRGWVRKDHKPGSKWGNWSSRKSKDFTEQAFCSIGAVRDTLPAGPARTAALVALAETINKKEFDRRRAAGYSVLRAAEHIIIGFNDNAKTTWPEVRSAFTKAARRLSQRKT